MNNLLSYCGLVDAKIRASDKDLPVSHVTKAISLHDNRGIVRDVSCSTQPVSVKLNDFTK